MARVRGRGQWVGGVSPRDVDSAVARPYFCSPAGASHPSRAVQSSALRPASASTLTLPPTDPPAARTSPGAGAPLPSTSPAPQPRSLSAEP